MTKKNLKNGLRSSLLEEEKKVEDKFSKAEQHFKEKKVEKKEELFSTKKQVVKPPKELKEKAIRDAFTFPPMDHTLFAVIQKKALGVGIQINKSEIVRAGLHCLDGMSDKDFRETLGKIEKLKTGRK